MEVLLKKCKINKSILSQSERAVYSSYINTPLKILGHCVEKSTRVNKRTILLYDEKENVIRTLPFVHKEDVRIDIKNIQEPIVGGGWSYEKYHIVSVKTSDYRTDIQLFRSMDLSEANDIKLKIDRFIEEVYNKGQIYI